MPKPEKPGKPVKPGKGDKAPEGGAADTARMDAMEAQLLAFESRIAALESSQPGQAIIEAPVLPG